MKLPYIINKKIEAIIIALLAVNVIASFYFYSIFPEKVPIHWNIAGEVDNWAGPAFGAFFFPTLMIAIYIMMVFIPLADPHKERYKEFGRAYQMIRFTLVGFLSFIYFVASLAGAGYDINIARVIPTAIGLIFIIIGNFMPKFKKNWFTGIKTPWTLSNEKVWQKTHQVGGKLFIISGILIIASTAFPPTLSFAILIFSVFLVSVGSIGYSYWYWRKIK